MTNGKNWSSRVSVIFMILLVFTACTDTTAELPDPTTEEPNLPTQNTSPTLAPTAVPPATDGVESTQTTLPLPTNFFITSTPFVGPTKPEAIEAPEGKFLFIEMNVTYTARGNHGGAIIDYPTYWYSVESNTLTTSFSLADLGFDERSWGLWGISSIFEGATFGQSSQLHSINQLPNTQFLLLLEDSNLSQDLELKNSEIVLVKVFDDGTVALQIGGERFVLRPGAIWYQSSGQTVTSESGDGYVEIHAQIINHGWLDREIIRANP